MQRSDFDFDVIGGPSGRPPARPAPGTPAPQPAQGNAKPDSVPGK